MKKLFSRKAPLYLLTDTRIAGLSHTQIAKKALDSGIKVIQLRDKESSKRDIFIEALALRSLTKKYKAVLIINDHIDIALAANADGVHLGQDDMPLSEARKIIGPGKIIGISTHSLAQAKKAQNEGADYIGFGPLFQTDTKDAGKPKGLKTLQNIKRNIDIPIAAIGGITCENIKGIFTSGADAAAVASGILKGSIKKNIKAYLAALDQ